jgi:hypothetical protein
MSNTWDTVFEEGFSSVPVCNNCLIICLLVLQALTCHFVRHVPVFCNFQYCCIPLIVYLCDVLNKLISCTSLNCLSFCLRFIFFSFIKVITGIFNKRYFASLTCVFYLRHSSNWNPHRLHSEPFPPKENHNVRLLRFDDDHDHICYRFAQVQIFGGKVMYSDHYTMNAGAGSREASHSVIRFHELVDSGTQGV